MRVAPEALGDPARQAVGATSEEALKGEPRLVSEMDAQLLDGRGGSAAAAVTAAAAAAELHERAGCGRIRHSELPPQIR